MPEQPSISFHGAAGTVTGSCHLVTLGESRVLVDCGMFQGSKSEKELNYRAFPFDPRRIDAVILTHAHIDHSGLLPKLVKAGFDGPIFATRGTIDLCSVMLPDSAHIQDMEVETLNRRNAHRGRRTVEPIYDAADAARTVTLMRPVELKVWQEAADGIRFRLWNAGHLLGSASIEMEAGRGTPVRLAFSGDIGPHHKLLQYEPEGPSAVDYVITESTYGNTEREELDDAARLKALKREVDGAYRPGGALLIPSFAVERTQELVADLMFLMQEGQIPHCPVIIDSPLATRASEIFLRHARDLENGEQLARAFRSRNLRFTETVEQSKSVDHIREFHIVIAASGMCDAGRIRHRLKNWLWREEGTVLLVGYQAAGTLGRILAEGASTVRIQGEEINVRARIRTLDVYSGHADAEELTDWVRARSPISGGIFLVHGEEPQIAGLAARLADFLMEGQVIPPRLDSCYRLAKNGRPVLVSEAPAPRIEPMLMGSRDWHNEFQSLVLDLQHDLMEAADDRQRGVILRRMRRALSE
ncbi:MBL fold metallo-hydrolase [Ciceribacter sp. L1K23]|uniref:MBL fold metallo-hydrolase n=1 Tax=Ciceribacter sp. L1K23 TaxID=2820276 RepID=UPI001B8196DA|nr:MBL fold metallo-hydrolase [Ciceribacter sp. L1K23]MBR0556523.1 MBL fold metallo-hydrolase [Ciceribacter sp. L1K23]